jgi:hypothetical protein
VSPTLDISQEYLTAMAEIAIGLIGFSGIVTVLGQRAGGSWNAEDFLQLRTQVEPSVIVLFSALLPGTLTTIIDSPEAMWRICNALVASFTIVGLARYRLRARSATELISQKILGVLGVVTITALACSALNLIDKHIFVYLVNLLLLLATGVHNFMLQLFQTERQKNENPT